MDIDKRDDKSMGLPRTATYNKRHRSLTYFDKNDSESTVYCPSFEHAKKIIVYSGGYVHHVLDCI